ncbi:MAG: hypothetical protein B7Z66_03575 [Chromatiales bacterium 21-64-14]|nr:MAG: hypothetical protein B7Z66_03575 [Chromatiales bacterium 21-64-14]HQU14842.1 carbohydrate porin [Gammaproteobacteria bacterium]
MRRQILTAATRAALGTPKVQRRIWMGIATLPLALALGTPAAYADPTTVELEQQNAAMQNQLQQLQQQIQDNRKAIEKAGSGTSATNSYVSDFGTTTISGKMYGDLTYKNLTGNGSEIPDSGFGTDVKRFYFGVGHQFNDIWSVNLTTDFNYSSSDKNTQVFIKKAYIQAKFSPLATVRLGSADMPWIPYDEGLYGFRYVENTLIDRLGFGNSADWGAHLLGKEGMFNYAFSGVNGGGYHNPPRSKNVDFAGRVGVNPLPGMSLAVGGYVGKLAQNTAGATTFHTAKRLDLIAAYVQPTYRLGVEYFKAYDWNTVANPMSDRAYGLSAWGSVSPMRHITLFARFDYAKPSQDLQPGLKDYYFNVGVQDEVYKNVLLALAFKHEKQDNGSWKTSNTSFNAGQYNRVNYNEVGLWTQVKF